MKINVGIDEKIKEPDIEKLVEYGADEFFCGIMTDEWVKYYGRGTSTNRRTSIGEQFINLGALKKIVNKVHDLGKKITVVFNAHTYIEEQYPIIMEYLRIFCGHGIDAVTVTNLDLLCRIVSAFPGLPVYISSDAGVYNSEAAKFYKNFGIKRIILPRHLTVGEIKGIVEDNPGVEYECFIMEMRCAFEGAYCALSHGWATGPLCQEENKKNYYRYLPGNRKATRITPEEYLKTGANKLCYDTWCHKNAVTQIFMRSRDRNIQQCGLCKIADLKRIGVTALKIATRGTNNESKFISVQLVRKVIDNPAADEEFCRHARGHREICDLKYMCYYR